MTDTLKIKISVTNLISNAVRRLLGSPVEEKKMLELRYVQALEDLQSERRKGVYHPSSLKLGGKNPGVCLRKLAYSIKDGEHASVPNQDTKLWNVFQVGTDAHGKYQAVLQYCYPDKVEVEVVAEIPELKLYGHCDAVITDSIDGKDVRIGVEFKTTASSSYKKMVNQPMTPHKDQAAAYAAALGLDYIVFVYENKDNQELREFVMSYEELHPRWLKIKERLEAVNELLDRGELPPKRKNRWECSKCSFERKCKPFQIPRQPKKLLSLLKRR